MEGQGREIREEQGNNPIDSVNVQLVTTLAQLVECFKRQETRVEVSETADDIALERVKTVHNKCVPVCVRGSGRERRGKRKGCELFLLQENRGG